MSGSGYRDHRDYRRWSERDFNYDEGRHSSRDGHGRGRDPRRERYTGEERQPTDRGYAHREGPRRPPVTCYECGEPGHYRNQCPKLVGEASSHRGRSSSPGHLVRGIEKRSLSEEPAIRKQLEVSTTTIASMKNFIDAEQERKDEEERRKKENEKREQEIAEERKREELEQQARERRARKKEEKKKKEAEDRAAILKEMRMEMKLRMKEAKGKTKVPDYASDDFADDSDDSEIEGLSEQAERLIIHEKHKRGADKTVGDSRPVTTPAKRSVKRGGMDPKKLMLRCRHPSLKKPSPRKRTPASATLTRRRKIPASPGVMEKLKYVQENLQELGALNMEELKTICRGEDVTVEGKKMDIIFAITEKRAHTAYGTDEDEGARKTVEAEDEKKSANESGDDKESEA
ncbi:hypothetical protein CBR_g4595 [Chara braunii]|uniref:CCHC-type domain-containing protein n=1 Tax=Chara braunii TaxID=69332 RepID=A0A388KI85_CHABU|nr:hypothetical protein CBR_g4595 [Chara braunii]|eukprot:GBG69764.1 hypothetical protein CBR_g4595 [Chara braunii]